MMSPRHAILAAVAALLTAAPGAYGQEGSTPPPPLPEPPHLQMGGGEQQARDEMIQLFQEVEARLKEIDALLYDASAGEASLAGSEESVVGKLLRETEGKSEEVLSGIDRILEIASQYGSSQGGGSCEAAMEGESPLDGQPQGEQGQKEQTPEIGKDGEKPEGQEPHDKPGDGKQPNSPRESPAPPENRDAQSAPPSGEVGRVEVTDTAERWGDLPVHVRDLFRSEGGRDMPAQYRDWIDGYYRRLNKRP